MIILQYVTDVSRDEQGRIFAWRGAGTIAEFATANQAADYLDAHYDRLQQPGKELRFFTGSASLLMQLNAYLDQKGGVAKQQTAA